VYDPQDWSATDLALVQSLHSHRVTDPAETTGFRLYGQRDGSIRLRGELDATHADKVGDVLRIAGHSGATVLDLTGLEFADVAAMRVIAETCQVIARSGGTATIRGASETFRRMWRLARFHHVTHAIATE
jgi:anti-anti-sigma factor